MEDGLGAAYRLPSGIGCDGSAHYSAGVSNLLDRVLYLQRSVL